MSERAVVFDKAAWHLASVREAGRPDHQAYVHGGLFFGWAVDRGLHAPWLEQNTPDAFARYRAGEITGPELLARWDGAILDDMFGDVGLAFVASYFDPRTGAYFSDYLQEIARGLPSELHVPDDAESRGRVAQLLDRRFAQWQQEAGLAPGRPDLRGGREAAEREIPQRLTAGAISVTSGVPLPGGPLGVRVARPQSVENVRRALAGDRYVALLLAPPGRARSYDPSDLLETGILAEITRAASPDDRDDVIDIGLSCLARISVDGWRDEEALVAELTVLPEPEPGPEDLGRLDSLRDLCADVVKRRLSRGEPPGTLALAAAHRGPRLVDLVARELLLQREEALIVLEAPDLATRLDVVLGALLREP